MREERSVAGYEEGRKGPMEANTSPAQMVSLVWVCPLRISSLLYLCAIQKPAMTLSLVLYGGLLSVGKLKPCYHSY